jgi:hypothetical protein
MNIFENTDNDTKILIGRVIQGIHLIYCILNVILPYLINDLFWLCLLVINNTTILLLWYLLGGCFMNNIENWFLGKSEENEKSFMMECLIMIFGEEFNTHIMGFCSCIPAINTFVCIWKIYNLKMNKESNNITTTSMSILDNIHSSETLVY